MTRSKGLHDLQEFNIENANQSDYSRFLSIIAALYLPISYLTVGFIKCTCFTTFLIKHRAYLV